MTDSSGQNRLEPLEQTKRLVWAAAAGRCTLCNRSVIGNDDLGLTVPIGELAHNVGWSENSPRGESDLTLEERREADNLLLLCRNCHKPIDANGAIGLYSVEELARRKRAHEERIRFLTEIGADRSATVIRVVGAIRGVNPHLDYDAVLEATTGAQLFPQHLPGVHRNELELDLRHLSEAADQSYFEMCAREIDQLAARVSDGVRRDDITRLAVFGFARIPLLVYLGARLDDKVPAVVFQRHRTDEQNVWTWPDDSRTTPAFEVSAVRDSASEPIVLIVNLSGSVQLDELPPELRDVGTVYELRPVEPAQTGPTIIDSPTALAAFEAAARRFLALVEAQHGKPERVALLGAIPNSAAVTLGRVLMPNVSPAWDIYDRDEEGRFFRALEVRR